MKQENLTFRSGELQLEGRLALPPPDARGPVPGVVLCHPHPLYGGSMNNNVIHAVCAALTEKGIATLRFNFRGVGLSEGSYDGGRSEAGDVLAAVSYLAGREEINSSRVGLMGYSFSGGLALAAGMQDETVQAVAAVSPAEIPVLDNHKPRLVVCGSEDLLVPTAGILKEKDRITGSGAGVVEIIEGADHFWSGCEAAAADLITSFFSRFLFNPAYESSRCRK